MLTKLLKTVPVMIMWFGIIVFWMWYFHFQIIVNAILLGLTWLGWSGAWHDLDSGDEKYSNIMGWMTTLYILIASAYLISGYVPYEKIVLTERGSDYKISYQIKSDYLAIYIQKGHKVDRCITLSKNKLERIDDLVKGKFTLEKTKYTKWYSQDISTHTVFTMDK